MHKTIQIPVLPLIIFVSFTFLNSTVSALKGELDYWDAIGLAIAVMLTWQLWSSRNQAQEEGRPS
jgi:hypothetical protein